MNTGPTAESRHVEYLPLDDIASAVRNPKRHDLDGIESSIARFGFVTPSVLDGRTHRVVAGHGRVLALRAMRDAGQEPPAGVRLTDDGQWLIPVLNGWSSRSDTEADAYLVADNEWTIRGGWNPDELGRVLADIADVDPDLLPVTGYTADEVADLLCGDTDGEGDGEGSEASLLAIADVTVGEPRNKTATGDHWIIGDRHHLIVTDVIKDWPRWVPLLDDGALFVPYPGPYVPLTLKADDHTLVMVQPDRYIAGHILDKYEAIRGDGTVHKTDDDVEVDT